MSVCRTCGANDINLDPHLQPAACNSPRPPYEVQGCPWNKFLSANALGPSILNKTLQVILPGTLSYAEYPVPCSPGILGAKAADIPGQSTPLCAGFCDPGFYCPTAATVHAIACPRGAFCPVGSALPQLCPAGTHSNSTRLSSASECLPCPPGSACPTGSVVPTPCAPGSFAASPGASECAACDGGTYQPQPHGTSCLPCEPGSVCPRAASAPLPCAEGRHCIAMLIYAD